MDFAHDQLFDATKVRILTIVDALARFSPAVEPRFNWRGSAVVEVIERVCGKTGFPKTIRVDQGPEFISKDLDLWAYRRGVVLDFSRPDKPADTDVVDKTSYALGANFAFEARECLPRVSQPEVSLA